MRQLRGSLARVGNRRSARATWDYERSNLIERLDFWPTPVTRELAGSLLSIQPEHRGGLSQALLDSLARELSVPPVTLCFLNTPQKHRRRNGRLTYKEYAYYEPEGRITIYNVTAVRRLYLAPKAYLDTLIHEFLHHLDYHLLGLKHTYHTQGFYRRLSDLLVKLGPPRATQLDLF